MADTAYGRGRRTPRLRHGHRGRRFHGAPGPAAAPWEGWQDRWHARTVRSPPLRRPAAAVLRRPRRPRRRGPVPGERHPRPRHPPRAPQGGGAALLPVRRRQPHQRPEPGAAGRTAQGLRRARPGPARLLGQPQLGALPDRHPAHDGPRRAPPCRRAGHQRLRLVLGLPAVPREPRRRPRRPAGRGAAGAAGRQAAALLQPPRLRRPDDRRCAGGARRAAQEVRDGAHLAFTTHSIPTAAADTSGTAADHTQAARAAPTSPSTWTWRG